MAYGSPAFDLEAAIPKKILRNLRVSEISAVDRGAGRGVKILLHKRDTESPGPKKLAKIEAYLARNLFAEAEAQAKTEKREFSGKERRRLAGSGAAEDDGSFPIASRQDLKNAVRAFGRSKDPGKTKDHIISRARSLGLTSLLPDKWKSGSKKNFAKALKRFVTALSVDKALDFNQAQAAQEAREYADGMMEEVREAISSLNRAVCDIMCDESVVDKQPALETSFTQFHDHLAGIVPEGVEQALQAAQLIAEGARVNAQGALIGKDGSQMDPTQALTKIDELKVTKRDLKEQRKALRGEVKAAQTAVATAKQELDATSKRFMALLKMSPEHRAWFDHPENAMTDAGRLAFLDMPVEKRDEVIKAEPVEKLAQKRLLALPEDVRKQLEAGDAYRQRMEKREEGLALVELTKRATDICLPSAVGEHLATLRKAAPDAAEAALAAFEGVFKQITASAEARANLATIMKEIGGSGDGDTTSIEARVNKRVEEIMKADPTVTSEASAINKIATSRLKSDQELWQAYKDPTKAPV